VFTAADGSFAMKYPAGWARTDADAKVTFRDGFSSMELARREGFYQPTEDYARAVEVPDLAAKTAGFVLGGVKTVQPPSGPVVLITYQVDSPGDADTGTPITQNVERYEFAHDSREVVVTLSAPVGSDDADPWPIIVDSFTWLR
jgi:hypothetical protein